MPVVYFDSSAFVKLVVEEDGSELAATLGDGCDAAVSSRLAYPEVRAALAAAGRAHRGGHSTHGGPRGPILTAGADAVHVASVLAVGEAHTLFAVWDLRLRSGALAVGVQVVPQL